MVQCMMKTVMVVMEGAWLGGRCGGVGVGMS